MYSGVISDAEVQKNLCEKNVTEVLTYNQQKGALKKHLDYKFYQTDYRRPNGNAALVTDALFLNYCLISAH